MDVLTNYLYFTSSSSKNALFQNGSTVLHYAAARGKLSFVRELINHGADVNIEDNVSMW